MRTYWRHCRGNANALRVLCEAFDIPAPGARLGDNDEYVLNDLVGIGGNCVVYSAEETAIPRTVALKYQMPVPLHKDPEATQARFVDRLTNEVRLTSRLEHGRIAVIHHIDPRGRFYTMPFIENGRDLSELIETDGPLDGPRAAMLIRAAAKAVAAVHAEGIVHRDIKPGNLLVRGNGDEEEPLLVDFGLAAESEDAEKPGRFQGTPAYAAPEQARWGTTSPASDIYSLGATLFAALTGRAPVTASSNTQTLDAVADEPAPYAREFNPEIDREIEAVCHQCMASNPGDRYASADALADDLDRYLRSESVHARRGHGARQAIHRVRVPGAVAVVVLLVALAVWWTVRPQPISSLSIKYACKPEVWPRPTDVEMVEAITPFDDSGFEVLDKSILFDLSAWREAPEDLRRIERIEPAFATKVLRLRKRRGHESKTDRWKFQARSRGLLPQQRVALPMAPVIYRSQKEPGILVVNEEKVPIKLAEVVVDLSDIGNDYQPFLIVTHTIYWNGFQDQVSGKAYDWAAQRFIHDEPDDRSADLAVRLPKSKKLVEWGMSKDPVSAKKIGRASLPGQAPGSTYDEKRRLLFWQFRKPIEPGHVYSILWSWADRE